MGPTALLPLQRKACWGFFRPKNPTASAGCEPANLGTKRQHATSRPPKPIYTILGTCYSVRMTVWYVGWNSTLHIKQSSVQNFKYQVSYKHNCFSWWWAHSRPKHVQKRNKYTKKNCAPSWIYLQDYTGMYGQQSVKLIWRWQVCSSSYHSHKLIN